MPLGAVHFHKESDALRVLHRFCLETQYRALVFEEDFALTSETDLNEQMVKFTFPHLSV